MKQPRVLMKDVAKEAGVHQTTVSLALRNHPSLPQATRERIQKLAKDMGYRPDPALSALVAYRQATKNQPPEQVIAWLANLRDPNLIEDHHVYRQLIEGAKERAQELGYKLDVFAIGRDYKDSRSLNRVLKARGIQGVILGSFDYTDDPFDMDWDLFSVVKINQLPRHLAFDTIDCNQIEAVGLALAELRDRGFKRIGLALSEFEEVRKNFAFGAGYYTYRRLIAPEDRIEPFYFKHGKDYTEDVVPSVRHWAETMQLDALVSNWNSLHEVALELTREGNPCRFVPLDADSRTFSYGGINQDHQETGRRAVDMTVGQIKTFRRGMASSPCMMLITPKLMPLSDSWPPQEAEQMDLVTG